MKKGSEHKGFEYVPVDFDPFSGNEPLTAPTTEAQKEIIANIRFGGRPANCAYNESVSLVLKGPFIPAALYKATKRLVNRHQALRSTFSADGTAVMVAHSVDFEVPFIDLTEQRRDEQQARINKMLSEEADTEFDISSGPLFRLSLVRLSDDEHQLIMTFHHLICDGWSLGIIMQDLSALYSSSLSDSGEDLEPAPSFISANKNDVRSQDSDEIREVEAYWLDLYSGELPSMELEADKQRPRIRTYSANRFDVEVPGELIPAIRRIGASHKTSYISTLIALFECYLSRITGNDDITLGLPSAGQAMLNDQNLVGHYVNMLPLRSRIDESRTFAEYLSRRRGELLDAYEHQQLTFGRLLNLLKVRRDPSRIPLIPVSFNVDLGITNGVDFKDCDLQFFTNPRHFENHEIFINAAGSDHRLILECTYNTDLFEEEFVRSRMQGFLTFMEGVVEDPEKSIGDVGILSASDRNLLDSWMTEPVGYDHTQTIISLFNNSVDSYPDITAIDHKGKKVTYLELQQMALKIADAIKEAGAGKENFIGVCTGRTPEMIASLLGVMYTGAAYVPLDVGYPEERLRFIVEDAGCRVILTDDETPEFLRNSESIMILNVTGIPFGDADLLSASKLEDPASAAYVIYTSGSTGNPKGVVIEHRNAVALFAWAATIYDREQLSGVVASTSVCFDLSIFEIFNTLVSGGTMILIRDITELPDVPVESKPSLVNSVPSAIKELTGSELFPHRTINTINLAGEPLSQELVDTLYGYPGIQHVYDLYGPSEDTTYSTFKRRIKNGPEVIGKVLPNSTVYLVDRNGQRVQPGLRGEIWLSGAKVARGYLGRDKLTESRFIKDPFSGSSDQRVYRTGDIAKFNTDGDLVFLGRNDHQVKIRGYRIEPGEIESKMLKHPDVSETVCVPRKDNSGSDSLVCYYTGERMIGTDELSVYASGTLPDYMVPSHWVHVPEFPMTLNGKIDRKRLPEQVQNISDPMPNSFYEEPEGPYEEMLSTIFSDVLNVERVGRNDDFFEMGGHSLLGVRVTNMIGSQLGIKIALPVLFTAPTIKKLALVISGEGSEKNWTSVVPIKNGGPGPPLFCVHMHNGNIHRWRVITKYMDVDQAVYAIQPRGLDPKQQPHRSVEEMASYYVEQVQSIQPHGPYRLLGLCFSGMVVFEMAVLFQKLGEHVEFLGMVNNYAPPENPTMYKLKSEWNKFMRMEIGEKFNYAIQKNKSLGRRLFVNRNVPTDPASKEPDISGAQIGNDLRSIHSLALLNYHPLHKYHGDLTIIRTDEPIEDLYNEHLNWDRLIDGKIISHIIKGCDNDTIITDHPYNKELAVIVRDHLRALRTGKIGSATDSQKNSSGGASSAAIL